MFMLAAVMNTAYQLPVLAIIVAPIWILLRWALRTPPRPTPLDVVPAGPEPPPQS